MGTRCILFLISFFIACSVQNKKISLRWQNNKAIAIEIPASLLKEHDDLQNRLKVQLIQPGERSGILGELKSENNLIIFEPIVPFTKGLRYEVLIDNNLIAEIEIPKGESITPELMGIYPSQDTVPENLLKMYFQFSQPMVEGKSLTFMTVLNNKDTLQGIFLDLQPELWNSDGTMLTLWLDPGRIKRDLIPNRERGNPLNAGENYTLIISREWKSKEGTALHASVSKTFVATARDEESPQPNRWNVITPSSGTTNDLKIDLKESLDYSLLMETIQIVDAKQKQVNGTIQLSNEEQIIEFTPDAPWQAGKYTLLIEPRLEDLSGNNLNRPFDRDLTKPKEEDQKIFKRAFIIQ